MQWLISLTPTAQATIIAAIVSAVVGALTAIFVPLVAQPYLERVKSRLTDEASVRNARRTYEFDARKRLYERMEPLLFQLYEAAEGSYYRVASLVRTQKQGNLGATEGSWLASEGYYLTSTSIEFFFRSSFIGSFRS